MFHLQGWINLLTEPVYSQQEVGGQSAQPTKDVHPLVTWRLSTRSNFRSFSYLYYTLKFFYINTFCFYELIDYVAKRQERWRDIVFTNSSTKHT